MRIIFSNLVFSESDDKALKIFTTSNMKSKIIGTNY